MLILLCESCDVRVKSYDEWVMHLISFEHQHHSKIAKICTTGGRAWPQFVAIRSLVLTEGGNQIPPQSTAWYFSDFGLVSDCYFHPRGMFSVIQMDNPEAIPVLVDMPHAINNETPTIRPLTDLSSEEWEFLTAGLAPVSGPKPPTLSNGPPGMNEMPAPGARMKAGPGPRQSGFSQKPVPLMSEHFSNVNRMPVPARGRGRGGRGGASGQLLPPEAFGKRSGPGGGGAPQRKPGGQFRKSLIQQQFLPDYNVIINQSTLTDSVREKMDVIVKSVTELVQKIWPGATIMPFGAYVTGLATSLESPTLGLYIGNDAAGPLFFEKLVKVLESSSICSMVKPVTTVDNQSFISFTHMDNKQLTCIIYLKNIFPVRRSMLFKVLCEVDSRVEPLLKFIRYWGRFHNLTTLLPGLKPDQQLMRNYALMLHVLIFLETKKIIPTIHALQCLAGAGDEGTSGPYAVGMWDASFSENPDLIREYMKGQSVTVVKEIEERKAVNHSFTQDSSFIVETNNPNLKGETDALSYDADGKPTSFEILGLAAEYFTYLALLEWTAVVACPLVGRTRPRHDFQRHTPGGLNNLHPSLWRYRRAIGVDSGRLNPMEIQCDTGTSMVIQDPFDLSCNLTNYLNKDFQIRIMYTAIVSAIAAYRVIKGNINKGFDTTELLKQLFVPINEASVNWKDACQMKCVLVEQRKAHGTMRKKVVLYVPNGVLQSHPPTPVPPPGQGSSKPMPFQSQSMNSENVNTRPAAANFFDDDLDNYGSTLFAPSVAISSTANDNIRPPLVTVVSLSMSSTFRQCFLKSFATVAVDSIVENAMNTLWLLYVKEVATNLWQKGFLFNNVYVTPEYGAAPAKKPKMATDFKAEDKFNNSVTNIEPWLQFKRRFSQLPTSLSRAEIQTKLECYVDPNFHISRQDMGKWIVKNSSINPMEREAEISRKVAQQQQKGFPLKHRIVWRILENKNSRSQVTLSFEEQCPESSSVVLNYLKTFLPQFVDEYALFRLTRWLELS